MPNPIPPDPAELPGHSIQPGESADTGLFVPRSGAPLPAGASVLRALGASLHGMRGVVLRETERTGPSTANSAGVPAATYSGERLELQGEIARGGMGAVFKGRDVDLGRDVAVKVLLETHQGKTELLQRFVEEAQIHGQLQHPGVAPVYELGQFRDQSPYFTMKLVQGQTLARLLAQRNDPADDRSRFVSIFEQVCQTLAYAHARGVIHRDLKPSNIMVGAFGEVQVMDWGLGKVLSDQETTATSQTMSTRPENPLHTTRSKSHVPGDASSHTQAGSILGTLAYMPPEQALGEIERLDARADVFALGAILCEILTGLPPYTSADQTELWQHAAAGNLTDALARLERCVADDELTNLARHALAVDPADRPDGAAALAARLVAYRESVDARLRQAELSEAEAKMLAVEERRRRKLWLASAGAVVAVLLLGVIGTSWGMVLADTARKAEQQRAEGERQANALAQQRLAQIEKGNELLGSIFQDLNPRLEETEGKPLRVLLGDRLDRVSEELAANAVADPLVTAKLQLILGLSQLGLGHADKAVELLTRARATLTKELGKEHRDTATSTNDLALAYQDAGQAATAIPLFQEALRYLKVDPGPKHPDTAMAINNLGLAYLADGKLDKGIPYLEEALELHRVDPGPQARSTLNIMNNLGMAYRTSGKLDLALPLLEEALAQRRELLPADHFDVAYSSNNFALAYQDANRLDEAIALFETALEIFRAKVGEDNPVTLTCMNNLALAFMKAQKVDKGIPLLEKTLELHRKTPGPRHPATLNVMNNLAMTYLESNQTERALPMLKETLQLRLAVLEPNHFDIAVSTNNLALGLQAAGEMEEAIVLFSDATRRFKASLTAEHPYTIQCLANLVGACLAAKRAADAIEPAEELVAIQRRMLPADGPALAQSLASLAMSLLDVNRAADAEPLVKECLSIREQTQPEAWTTFNTRVLLGRALLGQKNYSDAEQHLISGYEGMKSREELIPLPGRIRLTEALKQLVRLYTEWEMPEQAAQWQKTLDGG